MAYKKNKLSEAESLRKRAEVEHKKRQSKTYQTTSEISDDLKLLHELQIHQIELEMQIEELRVAKEKAEEATEKASAFYDFAPMGYFTLFADGIISDLNQYGARMLGKEGSNLRTSNFRQFITRDTLPFFDDFMLKIFQTKSKQSCEVKCTIEGETYNHLFLEGIITDSKVRICQIVALDTTERKIAEEKLRLSEDKYKKAFYQNPCLIGLSDIETSEYIEVNPTFYDLLGLTPDEVIGKRAIDLFPSYKHERAKIIDQLKREGVLRNFETTINKKDGTEVNVLLSAEYLKTGNKNVMFTTAFDITERRQAAEMNTKIRQNYESFFNTIEEFLLVIDEQGNIIYANKYVIDRLGYSMEELIGQPVLFLHQKEKWEEAKRIIDEILIGKNNFCQIPIITKSGTQIPVETKVSTGVWNSKEVTFGISKDISQLKLSKEKFEKVFYLNPSVCGLSDIFTGKYFEVNDAFFKVFGFSKEEVIGRTALDLGILNPTTIAYLLSRADADGKILNVEVPLQAKNGDIKYVLLNAENILVNDQKFRFTVATDITERKHAEEMLEQSQRRLKALSDASFEAIFFLENGIIIDQNNTAERFFGYTEKEIFGKPGVKLFISEDRMTLKQNILTSFEKPCELTALRKDGTTFPAEVQGRIIFTRGHNLQVSAVRNISGRKQAERSLIESESRFRQLAEHSLTIIWEVNARGLYTFVSNTVEAVLGYRPDELVGLKYFYDLHPEEGREAFRKSAMEVFARKDQFTNQESVTITRNGIQFWGTVNGIPILKSDGTLIGYRGSTTDITQQKKQQEYVLKKVDEIKRYQKRLKRLNASLIEAEENERIRLAQFLHDDLGQILAIANIKLTTLLENKKVTIQLKKIIKESSKQLVEAIHLCRDQTYELNPPLLKAYGLNHAIAWKLDQIKDHFVIITSLETNTNNLEFNEKVKFLLYRIIGELINNALKHANATEIKVEITKREKEVILSVIDDGKGFYYDPKQIVSQNRCFGLFNISERLSIIGGKLIIDSYPDRGTKASVILPLQRN